MNIQVSNTDGQLRVVQNGRVRFYSLRTVKSVDSLYDTNNDYYLVVNFIANDKENALNIYLKDITNQATWTNTSAGAEVAKGDISGWMQDAIVISGTVSVSNFPATQPVSAASLPLPTGAATEATLLDVKTSVQLLDDCVGTDNTAAPAKSLVIAGVTAGGTQQTIEVNASGHVNISDGGGSITVDGGTGVLRTPTFLRPTGANGTILANTTYSMSFASVGTANATVGGITLKPGETLSFDAGAINNTLGAVTYSTLTAGAELIIITLT